MIAPELDETDIEMLKELQTDGRMSNSDLAERVGLSPTPCLRRLRRLEQEGFIQGYSLNLDRAKVGLELTVFVGVKVARAHDVEANAFVDAVLRLPEVVSCHLVSGEMDFLLQVVVPDLQAYEHLLLGTLLKLPSVQDIRSNFAIRTFKSATALPLDHLQPRSRA
ncbi:MAG TPA: Lrp/AsnC family transcriptional regulator [Candidatus Angelobacter sp.]|nr:Lrp/AsnC family transcriptional regulator [Candidatus Angelobacter sp.]